MKNPTNKQPRGEKKPLFFFFFLHWLLLLELSSSLVKVASLQCPWERVPLVYIPLPPSVVRTSPPRDTPEKKKGQNKSHKK